MKVFYFFNIRTFTVHASYNKYYISAFTVKVTVDFPSMTSGRFQIKCKFFTRVNTIIAVQKAPFALTFAKFYIFSGAISFGIKSNRALVRRLCKLFPCLHARSGVLFVNAFLSELL